MAPRALTHNSLLDMHAPTYRWVCHKCAVVNVVGASTCANCGFGSVASAVEIATARGEPNPIAAGYHAFLKFVGGFTLAISTLFPWW